MPWRLIGFIVLFAIFLAFIGFNLENNCTISFGFAKFEQVPVYLTAFASFIFGMLCTIPFAVSFRVKKKQKIQKIHDGGNTLIEAPNPEPKKRNKKAKDAPVDANQSDYGID